MTQRVTCKGRNKKTGKTCNRFLAELDHQIIGIHCASCGGLHQVQISNGITLDQLQVLIQHGSVS